MTGSQRKTMEQKLKRQNSNHDTIIFRWPYQPIFHQNGSSGRKLNMPIFEQRSYHLVVELDLSSKPNTTAHELALSNQRLITSNHRELGWYHELYVIYKFQNLKAEWRTYLFGFCQKLGRTFKITPVTSFFTRSMFTNDIDEALRLKTYTWHLTYLKKA